MTISRRMLFAAATAFVLACRVSPAPPVPPSAPSPPSPLAAPAPPAPPALAQATPQPLASATQLVVVTTSGWHSTSGELRLFVRGARDSSWRPSGTRVPIVV